jgi:hypothetical protein
LKLEGEVHLSASIDRLGHVTLEVELGNDIERQTWQVTQRIQLEAGQLERIAAEARRFGEAAPPAR